jgi:tail tube protein
MTDLQSTNRVKLAKVRETSFGVTPANPAFKAVRQTSSGLNANPKTVITSEIRGDRQVTDLILVGEEAGGPIGGELAFNVADDDLEGALQGTWSNNPSITVATIDAEISDVSATTLTVAAGGAAFVAGMLTFMSILPHRGEQQVGARQFVDRHHDRLSGRDLHDRDGSNSRGRNRAPRRFPGRLGGYHRDCFGWQRARIHDPGLHRARPGARQMA